MIDTREDFYDWMVWICPKCDEENIDSYKFTARPMCGDCESDFDWDEIKEEKRKKANATNNSRPKRQPSP